MEQSVRYNETKCSVKENKVFVITKQSVRHNKTNSPL